MSATTSRVWESIGDVVRALQEAEAERDEALAAIARVRALVRATPAHHADAPCNDFCIPGLCASILAALDGDAATKGKQ